MELKEIRIFHNSQDYEFKTREALAYYIKNHFQTTERNRRFNFKKFNLVKNITMGSIALFWFPSDTMGWEEISASAVFSSFQTNDFNYEGFIMFQLISKKSYDPLITVKELKQITKLTFHLKENTIEEEFKTKYHLVSNQISSQLLKKSINGKKLRMNLNSKDLYKTINGECVSQVAYEIKIGIWTIREAKIGN